ncbi:hypothetical protein [Corynebacterium canis]|uniref:hypothetical protein n=1 Tax=Corynebacterium canis TaxID=679663 RepID=UPI001FED03C9|nr:hypothetical protein [Corynebacterium canis]
MSSDPQLVAYGDESSVLRSPESQEYLICATILERAQFEQLRNQLLPLLLPGQIKLHRTDESAPRRRSIVKTISEIESIQVIVTNSSEKSKKTERYRRKCLERLYYELVELKVYHLTLESRQEAQNRKDIKHLAALQSSGVYRGLRISHARGGDDPLLWIPDVVLGALNATKQGNPEYWDLLKGNVLSFCKAEDSL